MKKWDVVIIGSGISSLITAALLSKKGKSVCVLEQYIKPGGYLHCFNRFGLRYDTGSHYIGGMDAGQPFHTLLSYLGAYEADQYVPLDPDGFDVFQFPDFSFEFPKGYPALLKRFAETFPKEKDAIATYFKLIQTTAEKFPTYSFQPEYDDAGVMESMQTRLSAVVDSLTQNTKIKAILYTYSAIHGVMPWDMSLGFHALVTDSMIQGPVGFKKGGDALTQSLIKVIENHGGKIYLKTKIEKLITENKEVLRAETNNGQTFEAEWFISGAHPKLTYGWIDQNQISPAFQHRLGQTKESTGMFGIYAYSKEDLPLNRLKNYYFFRSDNPEDYLFTNSPTDNPGIVFATSPDRMKENQDKHPITFHAPGPINWFEDFKDSRTGKRSQEYHNLKGQIAEKVFNQVAIYSPKLIDQIEKFETSTPLTNLYFNGSPEGSSYGIYHSIENTGMRSIGPRTHFKNLLLTGQSTLCPGILGAAISGLRTAGHLIGIKSILRELQEYRGGAL